MHWKRMLNQLKGKAHQRLMYNGHKRVHALKFQSVALPNGLIANLYGPVGKDGFQLAIIYK